MPTEYSDFNDFTRLQKLMFDYMVNWAKTEKTPVPKKNIIIDMKKQGIKLSTVKCVVDALLKQGYIRKSCSISNRTYYIIMRTV